MPDTESDPQGGVTPIEPADPVRRRRAANIAIALGLLVWVVIIYICIMIKVHHDIHHPAP